MARLIARLIGRMRTLQRMVVFAAGFGCGLHGIPPRVLSFWIEAIQDVNQTPSIFFRGRFTFQIVEI